MIDPRSAPPCRSTLGFPAESQLIKTTASGSMVVGTDGFACFTAIPNASYDGYTLTVSTATTTGGVDASTAINQATLFSDSIYANASFGLNTRYVKFVAAAIYVKYSGRADEAAGQFAAKVSDYNGKTTSYSALRVADGAYTGPNSEGLVLPWFPMSAAVCDPIPYYRWPLQQLAGTAGGVLQFDPQTAWGVFSGTAGSSFDIELVCIMEISGPGMASVTVPPPLAFTPHPSSQAVLQKLAREHHADHKNSRKKPWYSHVWSAMKHVINNPLVRTLADDVGGRFIRSAADLVHGRNVPSALGQIGASAAPLLLTL